QGRVLRQPPDELDLALERPLLQRPPEPGPRVQADESLPPGEPVAAEQLRGGGAVRGVEEEPRPAGHGDARDVREVLVERPPVGALLLVVEPHLEPLGGALPERRGLAILREPEAGPGPG